LRLAAHTLLPEWTTVTSALEQGFRNDQSRADERIAADLLGSLIQQSQYVGEVFAQGYETALVQIHDRFRREVGGVPALSFLVATRLLPGAQIDFTREDSSIVLLRVLDAAPLPNSSEAERVRSETAQRVSGEDETHWDSPDVMDASTAHLLSFAGLRCRVIGTFYLDRPPTGRSELAHHRLLLRFGSDLSNFYPNQGLKVYKPNGDALRRIVNYRDLLRVDADAAPVVVGEVRYASTNRSFQGTTEVPVEIVPEDLLGQKTALFGMTRIGKSNTTKIVLKSVFELRYQEPRRQRIGQIVFDPNGEYANENTQDAADKANPTAIKNVWRARAEGDRSDVVTFGSRAHANDPGRTLMLVNFYEWANLQIGKEIIDSTLSDVTTLYMQDFRQASLIPPDDYATNRSAATRFDRRVLAYRALLAQAGYARPAGLTADTTHLFNTELLKYMRDGSTYPSDRAADYAAAADTLGRGQVSWESLPPAFEALHAFIHDRKSGYSAFDTQYRNRRGASGDQWADAEFRRVLSGFSHAGGAKQVARAIPMHTHTSRGDYRQAIYAALLEGKLVIVDQSGGDEAVNRAAATRVMEWIFHQNREAFRAGKVPPDMLVYVEEAHTILPSGSESDMKDIWVRTAKEGAKYHIGLVYATQEVSGVQKNILKNTSNWFIGHLNNTDETKELVKYYDFEDFESSIRRAQDKGFLRVKTLSNLFVVPAQIALFAVGD
jgi:Helicase HerA, central domain